MKIATFVFLFPFFMFLVLPIGNWLLCKKIIKKDTVQIVVGIPSLIIWIVLSFLLAEPLSKIGILFDYIFWIANMITWYFIGGSYQLKISDNLNAKTLKSFYEQHLGFMIKLNELIPIRAIMYLIYFILLIIEQLNTLKVINIIQCNFFMINKYGIVLLIAIDRIAINVEKYIKMRKEIPNKKESQING